MSVARTRSLRRQLLAGILLPLLLIVAFNTWSLYREALGALNTAYDRTLLASAKSISEQLDVTGYDDVSELRALVPYSALEANSSSFSGLRRCKARRRASSSSKSNGLGR